MSSDRIQQLDENLRAFVGTQQIEVPRGGWVRYIRKSIRMTLEQLGKRLDMTRQGVKKLEEREAEGAVTIKSLKEVAKAMDMHFVYGFVPTANSVDDMVYAQARRLAQKIILSSLNNSGEPLNEAQISASIDKVAEQIKKNLPKYLWK